MSEIVGIDLGTTKSAVAVWRDGAPHIIPDPDGNEIIPSVVALDPDTGEWMAGYRARAIAVYNPGSAIYSIKRLMGRRFQDKTVQDDLKSPYIAYRVEESPQQGGVEVVLGDRHLTPQEVSAKILQQLKLNAEAYLGHLVTQAVITVPAYFHDSQRQATRDAGRIAGLEVKRVVNEPTAACLAFGYQKLAEERKCIAVYDLGGGTFDISILEVGRGPFRVLATNGDTHLGSSDLDWWIVEWALDQIGGGEQQLLSNDQKVLARLRAAVEQVKIALSSAEEAHIRVPGQLSPSSSVHDLDLVLTRAKLEELAERLLADTLVPCSRALADAELGTSDIAEVLLVGGPTQMPILRRKVRDFFGREPNTSVPPEEVVALGAAVQAAILAGEATGLKLADVVPLTLGVSAKGRMETMIPRNTWVPVKKTKTFTTDYDNQESVEVQVYQGEHRSVDKNVKLGSLILGGIGPAPRGKPEINVVFHMDEDSILHVSARESRTGNYEEITITDALRLSDEEIENMIRAAEADTR